VIQLLEARARARLCGLRVVFFQWQGIVAWHVQGGMPLPSEAEGEREGVLEGVANYAAPLTFILSSSRGRGEKDRIKRPRRFDLTRLRS